METKIFYLLFFSTLNIEIVMYNSQRNESREKKGRERKGTQTIHKNQYSTTKRLTMIAQECCGSKQNMMLTARPCCSFLCKHDFFFHNQDKLGGCKKHKNMVEEGRKRRKSLFAV